MSWFDSDKVRKEWETFHVANKKNPANSLRLVGNPTIYCTGFLHITGVAGILPSVPGILSCGIGQSHVKLVQVSCACRMITQLQKGHVKNSGKGLMYGNLFPFSANVEQKPCTAWCGAYHSRWSPQHLWYINEVFCLAAAVHLFTTWSWPYHDHDHDIIITIIIMTLIIFIIPNSKIEETYSEHLPKHMSPYLHSYACHNQGTSQRCNRTTSRNQTSRWWPACPVDDGDDVWMAVFKSLWMNSLVWWLYITYHY